jgi:type I restriction enzyme S subunit
MKPYPAYKDSGIEWIGEVPEHWEVKKTQYLLDFINGNGFPEILQGQIEGDYPFFKVSDINSDEKSIINANNYVSIEDVFQNKWKIIPHHSIIFPKIGEALRKNHRKINENNCLIDNNMMALHPKSERLFNINFLYYLFCNIDMEWYINPGAVPSINTNNLKFSQIPLMPFEEQQSIATFLDQKTSQIDNLIEKKQRQIELLKEERTAIINQMVTKGLNPDVPLKDSGIEWLGEVPEHWKVKRLKSLVIEAVAGPYGSSLTKAMYTQQGYRVYGQQQVIADDFNVGDYYISAEKFSQMHRYRVFPGDVLITVMGTVGRVAVVPENLEPGIINPRLVRYRPDITQVRARYLQLVMQGSISQAQLREAAKGSTMEGLNMQILGKLNFIIPPLREQDTILEEWRLKSKVLASIEDKVSNEITLLQEYRTSLISEAVTGKIDVRNEIEVLE